MASKSSIEWTDATWNPIRGCTRVSEGCRNCYAERMAARRLPGLNSPTSGQPFAVLTPSGPRWTGNVELIESALDLPLRWTKPKRIFVNSMSDLFHASIPDQDRLRVFAMMGNTHIATCSQARTHTLMVLTKRHEEMRDFCTRLRWRCGLALVTVDGRNHVLNYMPYLPGVDPWTSISGGGMGPVEMPAGWMPPQIWLGVSVEDQEQADKRIPVLLDTPAAVRFVSAEPLLGPVDLARYIHALDWVIVGGESGKNARPMHPNWARVLRDECVSARVAFFFKQWGGWFPYTPVPGGDLGRDVRNGVVEAVHPSGETNEEIFIRTGRNTIPGTRLMRRAGKKIGTPLLDGRRWMEFPAGREWPR
jgi:protein gp37